MGEGGSGNNGINLEGETVHKTTGLITLKVSVMERGGGKRGREGAEDCWRVKKCNHQMSYVVLIWIQVFEK